MTLEITHRETLQLMDWDELTPEEQKELDYLDSDEARLSADFVRYRGAVYNVGDTMAVERHSPFFPEWHGYSANSYFSGVLFKVLDHDEVMCATYFS